MITNNSVQVGLISRRQAAEILGVTPKTIRRYEKSGRLTPIRLNNRVTRYRKEQLDELIQGALAKQGGSNE